MKIAINGDHLALLTMTAVQSAGWLTAKAPIAALQYTVSRCRDTVAAKVRADR